MLLTSYEKSVSELSTYSGIEGLKRALNLVLTLKQSFTYFGGGKRLFSLLNQQGYYWLQETERLKIKGQVILSKQELISLPTTVTVRFAALENFSENITITCGDTSIIISLIDSIQTTIIDNPSFTQFLRNQFLFIWNNISETLPYLPVLKQEEFSRRIPNYYYHSTWEVAPEILERIQKNKQAAFVLNLQCIRNSFYSFKKHFPDFEVYFSVKSNLDGRVLKTLQQINAKFEVVAYYELEAVLNAGAKGHDIIYSGPVKRERDIIQAYDAGVRIFAVDSYAEIDKLAQYAPQAKLILRVKTDDSSSQIKLSTKYGVTFEEALTYLQYIKAAQLEPYGITYLVGAQNEDCSNWERSFTAAHKFVETVSTQGFDLKVINVAGGFPIPLHKDVPSLGQISSAMKHRAPNLRYFAEPGRVIAAEGGKMIFPIVSIAKRNNKTWLYIDASIFGSLFMIGAHQFKYPITAERYDIDYEEYTIASTSCDGRDIIAHNALLPKGLRINDLLIIHLVGGYSLPVWNVTYAGVPKLDIYYMD